MMARSPEALVAEISDEGVPSRYDQRPQVSHANLRASLTNSVDQVEENLQEFYDRFPAPASKDLVYPPTDNMDGWTSSFWTGQCWLAHETTGEDRFREAAETQLRLFDRRLDVGNLTTHDLGFLYSLSSVAGYRITEKSAYRDTALAAADHLMGRFWDAPGLIQAWGDPEHPEKRQWAHGRMIVDTMMNLPLLFWASEATGDHTYRSVAETHARTNAQHIVRSDGSTFHTFRCHVDSGKPVGGETHQGHSDDSCWARGQSWAIYGYALLSRYTDEPAYADLAARLANYFLHRLESDHVPRWDFDAPEDDQVLDTSAGAIAACGLIQLSSVLPVADTRADQYRNAALMILDSLGRNYTTDPSRSNGILTDGAYHRSEGNHGECCIWGDYFYLEGLVRATEQYRTYW